MLALPHADAGQVKCEGSKIPGCQRCTEKHLNCVYSESRVGKVVGKRRKRPLEGVPCLADPTTWCFDTQLGKHAIPSPPNSVLSKEDAKRPLTSWLWDRVPCGDDGVHLDFNEAGEHLQVLELDNLTDQGPGEMQPSAVGGLPTPGLSPDYNNLNFVWPQAFEPRPQSQERSACGDEAVFLQPQQPASASRTAESQQEDDETVCIKLLSHLKKHSLLKNQSLAIRFNLVKKTNAAIRRILRSRNVTGDYGCQLLLSSIMIHLTTLYEEICERQIEEKQYLSEVQSLTQSATIQMPVMGLPGVTPDSICAEIKDSLILCTDMGTLLKRKPYDGFQVLGRHESLHVLLSQKLKKALEDLS